MCILLVYRTKYGGRKDYINIDYERKSESSQDKTYCIPVWWSVLNGVLFLSLSLWITQSVFPTRISSSSVYLTVASSQNGPLLKEYRGTWKDHTDNSNYGPQFLGLMSFWGYGFELIIVQMYNTYLVHMNLLYV